MKGVNTWTKGSTWSEVNLEERKETAKKMMLGNKYYSSKKGEEHHLWKGDLHH